MCTIKEHQGRSSKVSCKSIKLFEIRNIHFRFRILGQKRISMKGEENIYKWMGMEGKDVIKPEDGLSKKGIFPPHPIPKLYRTPEKDIEDIRHNLRQLHERSG